MALMKCKMCGGDLEIEEGMSVAVCEYCGTKQTIPTLDNERKASLFGRAGRLLRACEFDKASVVFGDIVSEFPEEAEGYWGLLLCKYGVEYVDDPATGKKIPTCHRLSFENIMEDSDFEQALENADSVARSVYREEAKFLENLRKKVIEVSSKEEPYDVFICYKETAADGGRTVDSVMAQDIYDALTDKGLRVFFARITLEDKLGMEYEPYIFAALNSAKVMLAIGTDYEYFNAVWVKNEWSRFLKLIAKGEKKVLIPCYKDIDAYDMPKEFKNLQAQDMGKLGFMQDLTRGVCKILGVEEKKEAVVEKTVVKETVVSESTSKASALIERAFIFLEDYEWESADEYCEKVLDLEPKNAMAYLGKLCVELEINSIEKLSDSDENLENYANFKKAVRFAENRAEIENILKKQKDRIAEEECKEFKQKEWFQEKLKENIVRGRQQYISVYDHTVGIKSDGTSVAIGDEEACYGECEVEDWENIVAVSAGWSSTVGLKADGTVVAIGDNSYCQCDVENWENIVAISAGNNHTVGLKSDGTVVAIGDNTSYQCDVEDWENIVAISAGDNHTVGLKSDGTVVAIGDNTLYQCDVEDWENIVAVSAGNNHTVGLKSDGTVVAIGDDSYCQCDVEDWKSIITVSAGLNCTIGLKANGTVVAIGDNEYGQCNVGSWKNIVAVSAGLNCTIGLKANGTVVAIGDNECGQCNISGWKNIAVPCEEKYYRTKLKAMQEKEEKKKQIEEKRKAKEAKKEEEKKQKENEIKTKLNEYLSDHNLLGSFEQYKNIDSEIAGLKTGVNQCQSYYNLLMNGQDANQKFDIAEERKRLETLKEEKSKLGLFAGKEKKRLQNEIEKTENLLKALEIKEKINNIQNTIAEKEKEKPALKKNIEEFIIFMQQDDVGAVVKRYGDARINKLESFLSNKARINCFERLVMGNYYGQPIEWKILAVEDNKALLISKYALEALPYDESNSKEKVSWSNCYLRKWLNNSFISSAFTSKEKASILETRICDSHYNVTNDKIFLLDGVEVEKYMSHCVDSGCKATPHTKAVINSKGNTYCYRDESDWLYQKSDYGDCWWWTRSNLFSGSVKIVNTCGCTGYTEAYYSDGAVRPAMWIDLDV